MEFFGWVSAIALSYVAIHRILLLVIDGVRVKPIRTLVVFAVTLLAGSALAVLLVSVFGLQVDKGRGAERSISLSHPWCEVAIGLSFATAFGLAVWAGSKGLTWKDRKRYSELSRQIKLHLALVTGAAIFSVPFYWLVTTSLKPDERTNIFPPDIIPMMQRTVKVGEEEKKVYVTQFGDRTVRVAKLKELEGDKWEVRFLDRGNVTLVLPAASMRPDLYPVALWSNYRDALEFLPPEYRKGLVPLWNTIYVTALVIVGTVLSSSLVAFAFARLRWPGRDLLFVIMIATMMVPAAVTMLPVFLIYRALGWIDTLRPLWFGSLFGSGFNIFLLRQFFLTIPTDLEDAAKIDGCSYFRIYWNIMLPLIKPALAALTIFAFMGSWNNFMGPLIYISSPEKMTLAYALQLFQGAHGGEPAMMMAAATLVMLPVLVVFFFTQRYMIQGVTLTGLKG
ncbi:MAG: carbohydrate ABC transporter permease [Armatimonadetes bacterium]|nr:carbohydrate ABC transporter permease [Armatimonadota bacterium]